MTPDCESAVTNMPMMQSFEVMSGLFDIHRVCALVTDTNTSVSVRLGFRVAGK
jgi:hypothetical protein